MIIDIGFVLMMIVIVVAKMMNRGIIKTDPKDADKLNDLLRQVADEIIKHIKKQHEKLLPSDSQVKYDPLIILCNVYCLTLNFTSALHTQIIGMCLDMQANYNQTLAESGEQN